MKIERVMRLTILILGAVLILGTATAHAAAASAGAAVSATTPLNTVVRDVAFARAERPAGPLVDSDTGSELYTLEVTQPLYDDMQAAASVELRFRTRGFTAVFGAGPGSAGYSYDVEAGYGATALTATVLLSDSQARVYPPVGPNGAPLVTNYSVTFSAADLATLAVGDRLFVYLTSTADATVNPDANLAVGAVDVQDARVVVTP